MLLTSYIVGTSTADFFESFNGGTGVGLSGYFGFYTNPTNGKILELTINGTNIDFTFVSTIGVTAGNVLIGATTNDTIANLLDLLQNPGVTNANHVALSGGNQTLVGYASYTSSNKTLANTITKSGSETWAEKGFYYAAGTHYVTINGVNYAYTGGSATTTLTGVTPDPTGSVTTDDIVHQTVITNSNSSLSLALPNNDLISTRNNQVYVASESNHSVYISAVNDFKDFTFSDPRLVGEGGILTLDGFVVGFRPQEDTMYITAGKDQWYSTNFTLSSDNTAEALGVERLKTNSNQAAISQEYITNDKNNVLFVSNEPVLNTLGRVAGVITTPQTTDVSAPIVNEFNRYNFTGGSVKYFKNFIYVAVPREGVIIIYNQTEENNHFWEAPLNYPVSKFSIIDGELYGHSYNTNETYKLFEGYNFNGLPINSVAKFALNSFGTRTNTKSDDETFVEGYISQNGVLNLERQFNLDGCATETSNEIDGSSAQYVCIAGGNGSLGKESMGKNPLGGVLDQDTNISLPPHFNVIVSHQRVPYYLEQTTFSSLSKDLQWELICFGHNAMLTAEGNSDITI